jgi:hypothetical protein
MTTAADEAWIQNSLARLEYLEAQKGHLEARGDYSRLAEVNAEIQALYQALEAVADASESAPANASPAMASHPVIAQPMSNVPTPSPFGSPSMAPAAPAPMASVPFGDDFSGSDYPSMSGISQIRSPSSAGKWVVVGLLLVGGVGVGGWLLSQGKPETPRPSSQPGDAKVIMASDVPDDTQEPDAARGGSADRTPGTQIKETGRSSSRGRSTGRSRPRSDQEKPQDGQRDIDVGDDREPLAGID